MKKVEDVDGDWSRFVQSVAGRIQEHAKWYAAHRQDLMNQHAKKSAELEALKLKVSQASQSLVEQTTPAEASTVAPDVPKDVASLNSALAAASSAQMIDLAGDDSDVPPQEMSQDEVELPPMEDGVSKSSTYRLQPRAFARGAPRSPTQVAKVFGKSKQEKS